MRKLLLWLSIIGILVYIILEANEPMVRASLQLQLQERGLPTPCYANSEQLYHILKTA